MQWRFACWCWFLNLFVIDWMLILVLFVVLLSWLSFESKLILFELGRVKFQEIKCICEYDGRVATLLLVCLTNFKNARSDKVWMTRHYQSVQGDTFLSILSKVQKQSSELFYEKRYFSKFSKIHKKTPVPESLF